MVRKTLVLFALALVVALPAAAEATLDEIVATHIESKGGMDAIQGVKTMKMEGRLMMGPGMEAPLTIHAKRPASFRMDFEFQGMKGTQAFDGETGWQVMPFMGSTEPEKLTGTELEDMIEQSDFDGALIGYKEKGHSLELLGTEEVEGTEAYKLKLTHKNGNETTMFLDTEYCLELKTVSKSEMQGQEIEVEVLYGDYKEVEGMMVAHSITQTMMGQPGPSITFETVTANSDIDDDVFAMPVAEAAEAPAAKE